MTFDGYEKDYVYYPENYQDLAKQHVKTAMLSSQSKPRLSKSYVQTVQLRSLDFKQFSDSNLTCKPALRVAQSGKTKSIEKPTWRRPSNKVLLGRFASIASYAGGHKQSLLRH